MTWTYQQSTGILTAPDGTKAGVGYSGIGSGLDNPAYEAVEGVGPIPAGSYTIEPRLDPPDHLGPIAMPLKVVAFNNPAIQRSAFFMHGDNADDDHTASHGCIVMGPSIRQAVDDSPDSALTVIP